MRFLFDNGMPQPLAQALRILGKPVVHVRDVSELGPKAPDPLILEYSGSNGYFLLRAAAVKGVEPHGWELCKIMVKAWDDVERFAADNKTPFLALIKWNGRVSTY